MSNKIDQRIVEMSFENHQFEKGIKQSKNSLKDFSNALKHMEKDSGGFDGLGRSVEATSKSFSLFEQIAIGALRQVGAQAVISGQALVKNLSVDQLTASLRKYEEKISAVQTMVSAGYGLDEVEKTMEQLMWFSDETSYSFSDMAQNMGKFVSAGVGLETSSKAMQGIATWAAISGKNSQAASIAMFNMSQAISMGYVDTMNWRSIMNQNMNTTMFKQIAIGVAEATGAVKKGQITIQNFDTDLKKKWFTNEVLLKTLEQYSNYAQEVKKVQDEMGLDTAKQAMDYMEQHADKYSKVLATVGKAAFKAAQESKSFTDSIEATKDAVSTGWMKTYEILFGTLNEAKANFSYLTEILWQVFASRGERRNEMLRTIKELGGVADVFKSLKNTGLALIKPLHAVSLAMDQVFPPRTAQQWKNLTGAIRHITERMIISNETAGKIRRTFAGLFSVLDLGLLTVRVLVRGFLDLIGAIVPAGDGFLEVSASIGDFLVALTSAIKQSGIFEVAILSFKVAAVLMQKAISSLSSKVVNFIKRMKESKSPLEFLRNSMVGTFREISNAIKMVLKSLNKDSGGSLEKFKELISSIFGDETKASLETFMTISSGVVDFIGKVAVSAFKDFNEVVNNLNVNKIATFVTAGIFLMFVTQLTELSKAMTTFTTTAGTFMSNLNKKMFAGGTKIKDFSYAIGVLTASILVLSKIPSDDLQKSLGGLTKAILVLVGAYGALQAINVAASKALGGKEMATSAFRLVGVAAALAVMSVSLKVIAGISQGDIWSAVAVLGSMLAFIAAYQYIYAALLKIPGVGALDVRFFSMSIGIMAMTKVIKDLSGISQQDLSSGITKMSQILIALAAIETLFSFVQRKMIKVNIGSGMLGISASLLVMIGLLKAMSIVDEGLIRSNTKKILMLSGLLAGVEIIFGLTARLTRGKKLKTHILQTMLGLTAMVGLIALLSSFEDASKIDRGIVALGKMSLIIGGIQLFSAAAARLGGGAKLQRVLGSVTLTMVGFTGLIHILGDPSSQEKIAIGIRNITKMSALIVGIQLVMSAASMLSGGNFNLSSIVAVTAAIFTLTAALTVLSIQDAEALAQSVKALTIVSVAVGAMSIGMSVMLKSLSMLSSGTGGFVPILKSLVPMFTSLSALLLTSMVFIAAVRAIQPLIESTDWSVLAKFTAVLGLVAGLSLTAAKIPLGKIKQVPEIIPLLKTTTALIAASMPLFLGMKLLTPVLRDMEWETMAKFTAGMAAVVPMVYAAKVLAAPLKALSKVPFEALAVGALKALGVIGSIVLAMGGLAVLLDALIQDAAVIQNGIDIAVMLAEGFGRLLAAPFSGMFAESLRGLALGIAEFGNIVGDFDPRGAEGVKALADAILHITNANVVNGLTQILTLGLAGDPVVKFVDQVNKIVEGFKFFHGDDIDTAMENMSKLGSVVKDHLIPLIEVANMIPNTGGFAALFAGNNDIDDFGERLGKFIQSLSKRNIAEGGIEKAVEVMRKLKLLAPDLADVAQAASKIPNTGWMAAMFAGNNDIDDFGDRLAKFIAYLSSDEVTSDKVSKAVSVLKLLHPMTGALADIADTAGRIPNAGQLAALFAGDNRLDQFAVQVVKFIEAMNSTTAENARSAAEVINQLAPMVESLEKLSQTAALLPSTNDFGTSTLQALGQELKHFINTVDKLDLEKLDEAIEAIEKVTLAFKEIGPVTIFETQRSLSDEKLNLSKLLSEMLNEAVKTISDKGKEVSKAMGRVFEDALREAKSYASKFKLAGAELMNGLRVGVESEKGAVLSSISNVAKKVINTATNKFEVRSPSKVFAGIGAWCTKGLAVGIESETKEATKATVKMGEAVEESIRDTLDVHSPSKKFADVGGWVSKSIGDGISKSKDAVTKAAESVGIDTTSVMKNTIVKNITGQEGAITETFSGLMDTFMSSATPEATKAGNAIGSGIGKGIGSGLSGSAKEVKKAAKSLLDILQEQLEEKRYYGQLSLEEELKAYEKIRSKYKKGSEERKKIDREIYKLVKELYESQLSYIEGVTQAEKEAADKRKEAHKKYVDDVKRAEDDAHKRLSELRERRDSDEISARDAAAKRSEDREKRYYEDINRIITSAEEERLRAREDYASRQNGIHEKLLADIDAQNKAYENAVRSRADSIYGSYGLFTKVEEEPKVKGTELLENLRQQGAALSDWKQSLDALAGRGVGDALIEELQKLGPASRTQIKALLELTDEQLSEYVGLFKGKYAFARTKAEEELSGLKESTSKIIESLKAQASVDLANLDKSFTNSMTSINANMTKDLAELKAVFDTEMNDIQAELSERLSEIETTFAESSAEVNADLTKKLEDMKKVYDDSLAQIDKDVAAKLTELKSKYSSSMRDVRGLTEAQMRDMIKTNRVKLDELNKDTKALLADNTKEFDRGGKNSVSAFSKFTKALGITVKGDVRNMNANATAELSTTTFNFSNAGYNAATGFAKGINDGTYVVVNAARLMGSSAVNAAKGELKINSPSKVFIAIGQSINEGLADGITKYSKVSEQASARMVNGPIATVTKALAEMGDTIESDWEIHPRIIPVLDLSNVASNRLNGIFGSSNYPIGLTSKQIATDVLQNRSKLNGDEPTQIVNNINIDGMVVREEADIDKISDRLFQKQQAAMRGRGVRTLPR